MLASGAALVQDEMDVLRDESEAYARKLNAADVSVASNLCNGTIHDYGLLNVLTGVSHGHVSGRRRAQAPLELTAHASTHQHTAIMH